MKSVMAAAVAGGEVIGHEHWTSKGEVKLFLWEKYVGDPAKTKGAILFEPCTNRIAPLVLAGSPTYFSHRNSLTSPLLVQCSWPITSPPATAAAITLFMHSPYYCRFPPRGLIGRSR